MERYTVDGLQPAMAVRPETVDEVAAIIRLASELGLAVIPCGAGLHMDLGNRPSRYDLALDLTSLDSISDYSPEDLVVTVQAGVTLGSLNKHLAERGQFLALDTPLADRATVGGALSANLAGPSRLRYGTARDLVIGMTCVLSSGAIVHSGGRVVKNVAGYDLNKLYLGALGTLGVIVEVSFKLHPLPLARAAIAATYSSCDAAHTAAMAIVNSFLGAIAVEIAGPIPTGRLSPVPAAADDWLLIIDLAGLPAAVERQSSEASHILQRKGAGVTTALTDTQRERIAASLRDFGRANGDLSALHLRCNLLPSQVAAAVERLGNAVDLADTGVTASPGSGSVRLSWGVPPGRPEALVAAIRRELAGMGGSVTVERCPPAMKDQIDVWGIEGADVALMRAMKAAYDPAGILSPGRFVSRL